MILSTDTNLFLYAADPDSPHHEAAQRFFEQEVSGKQRFLRCGLVLVELYMQLRNPTVFKKPKAATGFRHINNARLAFTLRHHGVTHFATANEKHFAGFGFERVWRNPAGIGAAL